MSIATLAKRAIKECLAVAGYELHHRQQQSPMLPINTSTIDLYYQLYGVEAVEQRRFFNVGAGEFQHPAWTNIDHASDWYHDAQQNRFVDWDLFSLKAMPFGDGSAEVIYTSHTIEHISNEAAANVFRESRRVLKPGGFLRVVTPNIDLYYQAFRNGDKQFFYWHHWYHQPEEYRRVKLRSSLRDASIQQKFVHAFASAACNLHVEGVENQLSDADVDKVFNEMLYEDALNHCSSRCTIESQMKNPGNHMNWWNKDKLKRFLIESGFTDVYQSGYGQSFCPVLRDARLFDVTHPQISLYFEARR